MSGLNIGLNKLNSKDISAIYPFAGTIDVIKAIQSLPGVQLTAKGKLTGEMK